MPVDCICDNKKLSLLLAAICGFFFYCGLLLARGVVRPIIKMIPSEFYYDNLHGEIVLNLILINLCEIVIVSVIVSISMTLLMVRVYGYRVIVNAMIAISVYLLLSLVSLRVQLANFEFDWAWWIKIIRPLLASVIFFTVVRWVSNNRKIR